MLLREARLVGTLSSDGQTLTSGMMGGAVSYAELDEVVQNDPEIGPQFAREVMMAFIRQKLDIDLDGDGQFDALSAAFSFEAVRAVILRDSAVLEPLRGRLPTNFYLSVKLGGKVPSPRRLWSMTGLGMTAPLPLSPPEIEGDFVP